MLARRNWRRRFAQFCSAIFRLCGQMARLACATAHGMAAGMGETQRTQGDVVRRECLEHGRADSAYGAVYFFCAAPLLAGSLMAGGRRLLGTYDILGCRGLGGLSRRGFARAAADDPRLQYSRAAGLEVVGSVVTGQSLRLRHL